MAHMIFNYESKQGWLVEFEGKIVKLWLGEGASNFTGSLQELNDYYPEVMAELLKKKIVTFIE